MVAPPPPFTVTHTLDPTDAPWRPSTAPHPGRDFIYRLCQSPQRAPQTEPACCHSYLLPPLSKPWPCLSYSWSWDRINSIPHLIRYEM